ncbi:g4085 [Coccomyxa elongata]
MQSFRVFSGKAKQKSAFSAGVPAIHMRAGTDSGDRYYTWTLDSICDAIRYLVTHTFVTFGDRVFRQKVGIPMGTNPAVHFATLYLFSFEFGTARRGIYPVTLGITEGRQTDREPFLDMRLIFLPDGVVTTYLYDKRRESKFAGIEMIDIYYRIHHRVGLQPYPPLQLPLLQEHIVPAAN